MMLNNTSRFLCFAVVALTTLSFMTGCVLVSDATVRTANEPAINVIPPAPDKADIENDDLTAGELLEMALAYLRHGDDQAASMAFQRAIDTGYLSDAGRALAYWYIHLAEKSRGSIDKSINALTGFVVLAEDLLEEASPYRYASQDREDFIWQFDLDRRLSLARAVMSATWAERAQGYGLSLEHPVSVHNDMEMSYFIELASPCANHSQEVKRHTLMASGGMVEQVLVQCTGNPTESISYFFEIRNGQPAYKMANRLH